MSIFIYRIYLIWVDFKADPYLFIRRIIFMRMDHVIYLSVQQTGNGEII